jgi:hypothetical protein
MSTAEQVRPKLDLVRATLQDVVKALEEGSVSSVSLIKLYLGQSPCQGQPSLL